MNWSKVESALSEASVSFSKGLESDSYKKNAYVFPGAVLLVSVADEVVFHKAFGSRSLVPYVTALRKEMVFDVASLTKAVVTTTLAMKLLQNGLLDLDASLAKYLPEFASTTKAQIKLKHLLSHSSGYPAHLSLYRSVSSRESLVKEVLNVKLENLPGRASVYSDLGFILLGEIIERVSGKGLAELALNEIIKPLKLRNSSFIELDSEYEVIKDSIVPTNQCPWRKRVICGEVQDENTWVMGGVSAHAGLFSNALDLYVFIREILASYHGRGDFVDTDILRKFWSKDTEVSNSSWALGWDTPSPVESSAGIHFSSNAVGHLAYTGCSMWFEPEREVSVILLSNRVHPSTDNKRIKEFRPKLHNLVMEVINAS